MTDKDEEKEALFAIGEWCCYHGYADMMMSVMMKVSEKQYMVPKSSPFALQLQFYAMLTSLNEASFEEVESFERMLPIFDTLVRVCTYAMVPQRTTDPQVPLSGGEKQVHGRDEQRTHPHPP